MFWYFLDITKIIFYYLRLDILVLEDEEYARKRANGDNANEYYFKFALKPKCSEEAICKCTLFISDLNIDRVLSIMSAKNIIIMILTKFLTGFCVPGICSNQLIIRQHGHDL